MCNYEFVCVCVFIFTYASSLGFLQRIKSTDYARGEIVILENSYVYNLPSFYVH